MEINVNMAQFSDRFNWTSDTVHYGDKIAKCKGKMFTFDGDAYIRILTDMNIFFTATKG